MSANWNKKRQETEPMQTPVCSQPVLISIGLLLVAFITGCHSLVAGGFAYVTIQNHSAEEITKATVEVFAADGYRGGVTAPGKMVFEKEASWGTTMAREGFVNTVYGAQTINRARVKMIRLSGGSYRLECNAVLSTGGSDPFFQEEAKVGSRPYQLLLEKVAEQFK
jgi:hypothetical protein